MRDYHWCKKEGKKKKRSLVSYLLYAERNWGQNSGREDFHSVLFLIFLNLESRDYIIYSQWIFNCNMRLHRKGIN